MKLAPFIYAAILALTTGPAMAQALKLPASATRTFTHSDANGAYALPLGPYRDGWVDVQNLTGAVTQEVWRMSGDGRSSHALMQGLATQLTNEGFELLFQCGTDLCGGFDFRFAIDVVNEPHMHVDLGDYQFLSVQKRGVDNDQYATLLVSNSPGANYVQITRIGPAGQAQTSGDTVTSTMTGTGVIAALSSAPIAEQLDQNGYAVLSDLVFQTGSSDLGTGPFDSLTQLATYLVAHPGRTVALVGHTDAEGSLDANIALSKRRAASVRARLIDGHDLPRAQLAAEGVGFLSPLGSNLSDEGRTQNRRVEVVLTSTR